MKLIVGLGNIGKEYENTRHNIGFKSIDAVAVKNNVTISKEKFGGLYGEYSFNSEKIILLKPQKYINLSGEVIQAYVSFYKIDIEDIFIIHDDLDIEVGKYKLKYKGSSGGHNGLKDIENHLKTSEYKRLKIGISNNKNIDTKDYVLGKISKSEQELLDPIINLVPDIVESFLTLDFDKVMNIYNKK